MLTFKVRLTSIGPPPSIWNMTGELADDEQSEKAYGTSLEAQTWAEEHLEKINLVRSRAWFDTDDGGFWTEVEVKA